MATVLAVHRSRRHDFSKFPEAAVKLVAGLGVEGDTHAGVTVQHRSRVARDPSQPNLRQVHLLHAELFEELARGGFTVRPGDLGENISTRGVDLLALPAGTWLHLGREAVVEVTGLRNPCSQIDRFQRGLMAAVLDRDSSGQLIRKAGVMGVVLAGGQVCAGDAIRIVPPPLPHRSLVPV
ncbi:MAG: MOSC domain-containing protein [Polaromonas sp.]|uniref:MOSC domain-containing protein n=1 Tax=Polaromonas sp. TaxID=1869339 RepID=UPI0027338CEE|nr:MOSC domain-containing protein [Polaromonas sp.]MDP1565316.1 MOSC domain-containing protein [Polaromonas sp.]MDP3248753.1 MOSC domain-containing protein [Polaromonas sp.]